MRKYQKKIAILLMVVASASFFVMANPQKAEADISFDQICNIAASGLTGGITGLLSSTLTDGLINGVINKIEGKIGELVKKIPFIGGLFSGTSNPVPTNDKKANAEEKLKNCAQSILTKMANKYARNFINKTLSKYKIGNYLVYGLNLANQIYVTHQLKGKSVADQFLIRQNINKILGKVVSNYNLKLVYNKRSLSIVNYQKASTADILKDSTLAVLDDPLVSTPQGQQYLSEAAAQDVFAAAKDAASLQILTGQGNKDQFKKNTGKVLGADSNSIDSSLTDYSVDTPGAYIAASNAANVANVSQQDLKPQDQSSIIGDYAAAYIENGGNPSTDAGQLNSRLNTDSPDLESDFNTNDVTPPDSLFDPNSSSTGF